MRRIKLLCSGFVAAGVVAAVAPVGLAAPPDNPGCVGQIVAATNHASGAAGASGNPNASAGPGYFLGPATPSAIASVRAAFC